MITDIQSKDFTLVQNVLINDLGKDWSISSIQSLLEKKTTKTFAHYDDVDNNLIVFAICTQVLDELEILALGVLKEYRGKGQGKALLENMISQSAQNGIARIVLDVSEANKPAIELYKRSNFFEIARRKDYYTHCKTGQKSDAIVMELKIKE